MSAFSTSITKLATSAKTAWSVTEAKVTGEKDGTAAAWQPSDPEGNKRLLQGSALLLKDGSFAYVPSTGNVVRAEGVCAGVARAAHTAPYRR